MSEQNKPRKTLDNLFGTSSKKKPKKETLESFFPSNDLLPQDTSSLPQSLNFNTLLNLLGNSLFHLEAKGNLGEARRQSEQYLIFRQQGHDNQLLAEAYVMLGLVQFCSGDTKASIKSFKGALRVNVSKINDLAETLKSLAEFTNLDPEPIFRFRLVTEIDLRKPKFLDDDSLLEYYVKGSYKTSFDSIEKYGVITSFELTKLLIETIDLWKLGNGTPNDAGASLRKMAQNKLQNLKLSYEEADDLIGVGVCSMLATDRQIAPNNSLINWQLNLQEQTQPTAFSFDQDYDGKRRKLGEKANSLIAQYQESRELFNKTTCIRGQGMLALRFAAISFEYKDFEATKSYIEEALELFSKGHDKTGINISLGHLALISIVLNDIPTALRIAPDVGEWGGTIGNFAIALGIGLMGIQCAGKWLHEEGDYEKAIGFLKFALALFKALRADHSVGITLIELGKIYSSIGESNSATISLELARDTLTNNNYSNYRFIWDINSELFNLYDHADNIEGLERLVDFLQKKRELDISSNKASENLFDKLLEYPAIQANSSKAKFTLYYCKAKQLIKEGNWTSARNYIDLGLKVAEMFRTYSRAAYAMECKFYLLLENYEKAENSIDQLGENFYAAALYTQAKAYEKASKIFPRLQSTQEAKWFSEETTQPDYLYHYAYFNEQIGKYQAALKYYLRAIEISENKRDNLLGDEFRVALWNNRFVPKYFLGASRAAIYASRSAQGLEKRNLIISSFEIAEKSKARALLELFSGGVHKFVDSSLNSVLFEWRKVSSRLTVWRGLLMQQQQQKSQNKNAIEQLLQRISNDEQLETTLKAQLIKSNENIEHLISPNSSFITFDEVVSSLKDDAVLLQFLVGEEEIIIWLVRSDGSIMVHVIKLQKSLNLIYKIENFIELCRKGTMDHSLAEEIGNKLFDQFEESLRDVERLIVIPHGLLHKLPFQALRLNKKYLVERFITSILPSASMLKFIPKESTIVALKDILLVGNPMNMQHDNTFLDGNGSLQPLPAAEMEVKKIASLVSSATVLIGADATKNNINKHMKNSNILHFATHAMLSNNNPLLSGLALADGEFLSAFEIMGTPLSASMMVLSACQTGLGRISSSDDVVGLVRSLLASGVKIIIASLWPVDDISTSILMEKFYKGLVTGLDPFAALQTAQLALMAMDANDVNNVRNSEPSLVRHITPDEPIQNLSDYKHPYHWAPFMIVGAQ